MVSRNMWPGAAAVMGGVLVMAALVTIVIDNIQYFQQADTFLPRSLLVASSWALLALGLGAAVAGFILLPRWTPQGTLLAVAGSMTVGLLLYWLVLPFLVAVGSSVLAVLRARRIRRRQALEGR